MLGLIVLTPLVGVCVYTPSREWLMNRLFPYRNRAVYVDADTLLEGRYSGPSTVPAIL